MARPEEIIGLVSTIREKANSMIVRELTGHGIEGLAPSHGAVLGMLFRLGRLPMTEIARLIRRDNSTVTTLVDKLMTLGYVSKTKDPQDRRITHISLTKKGKAFQPIFEDISKSLLVGLYQGFAESEKETLARLLERMLNNC